MGCFQLDIQCVKAIVTIDKNAENERERRLDQVEKDRDMNEAMQKRRDSMR